MSTTQPSIPEITLEGTPTVYLDYDQCERFALSGTDPYYGGAGTELVVAASTLLRSKGGDGYDQTHKDLLKPLGSATLVLVRGETHGPGWFGIVRAIKGR